VILSINEIEKHSIALQFAVPNSSYLVGMLNILEYQLLHLVSVNGMSKMQFFKNEKLFRTLKLPFISPIRESERERRFAKQ